MDSKIDNYSDYATEYADMVKAREEKGIEQEPIMHASLLATTG